MGGTRDRQEEKNEYHGPKPLLSVEKITRRPLNGRAIGGRRWSIILFDQYTFETGVFSHEHGGIMVWKQ